MIKAEDFFREHEDEMYTEVVLPEKLQEKFLEEVVGVERFMQLIKSGTAFENRQSTVDYILRRAQIEMGLDLERGELYCSSGIGNNGSYAMIYKDHDNKRNVTVGELNLIKSMFGDVYTAYLSVFNKVRNNSRRISETYELRYN